MKRVLSRGQDLSVGCRRAARKGLSKKCPGEELADSIRSYIKVMQAELLEVLCEGLPCSSAFLLAQSLETVKIKIHRRDVLWAK